MKAEEIRQEDFRGIQALQGGMMMMLKRIWTVLVCIDRMYKSEMIGESRPNSELSVMQVGRENGRYNGVCDN